VTIIPRGRALGLTMSLPEKDRYGYSKIELTSRISMMFGGRVAEELIFGADNITTGAGDDIRQATNLARRMVTEWGMSEKLGPLRYSENEEEVFLGHSVTQRKNTSDATAKLIDEEIRTLVENGETAARTILTEHDKELHVVTEALLEYETLSGDEVRILIDGGTIVRESNEPPKDTGTRSTVPTSGTKAKSKDVPDGPGIAPEPQPEG
jgi:cell division protease FtsH